MALPSPIRSLCRPAAPFLGLVRRPRRCCLRAYSSSSSPPPSRRRDGIKFWPFFLIIGLGTAGYVALVNRRKGSPPRAHPLFAPPLPLADLAADMAPALDMHHPPSPPPERLPAPKKAVPAFSPADVTVVFVLGGPGAGKGTQCARLVAHHGFTHLSAGDLLRAEQDRPGSQFGDLIRDHIKNGLIVSMEVTVQLLENAMGEALARSGSAKGRFLIDGFPRKMDQAIRFEEAVCPARTVLFFDCPEDKLEQRLLERGKTSGRADDNADSIRKRFRTFVQTSMPVVDYYDSKGCLIRVDATPAPDLVFADTQKQLAQKLGPDF